MAFGSHPAKQAPVIFAWRQQSHIRFVQQVIQDLCRLFEFEELLKSGALVFHCNTCDADWPPSCEEIAKLRGQFSKNQS